MKYALVTGGTSGIGLAIVEALLAKGIYVFINYSNNVAQVKKLENHLAPFGGRFSFIRADLSDYAGLDALLASDALATLSLDYLIVNFGATDRTLFGNVKRELWDLVLRANVTIPFFLIQSLYERGSLRDGSSIICISSLMASIPHAVSVSYGISKSGLSALPANLVKYLSPKGVRINAIEPGFVDTAWQVNKPQDQRARIEAAIPLGRMATPEEVATTCIATLESTYMTGAVVRISGGYGNI